MLVVIVASGGHVIQKVIELAEPLGADDLRQAANYLNEEFSGLPLYRAREAVLERINEERLALRRAAGSARCELATSTFSDLPDDRPMYVEGAASLLDDATGLTVQTLQALLQMIEEKQKLLELLNEYIDGPGLTVVIGAEHLDPNLRPFSLVAVDLRRWVGNRHGRRDRSDPHALLPRDRRRRRRRAGGVARAARSQLTKLQLRLSAPDWNHAARASQELIGLN